MPEQRFDRLPPEAGLFMQVWADKFLTDIETALDDIEEQLALIQRVSSYTSPTAVLTAADAGADVTITIAGHDRIYADGTTLAITGGTLTGRAYSTTYVVYYTDTTLADTTPTFQSSTSIADGYVGAADGVHVLGVITTPAAAAPPVDGGGAYPPGVAPGGEIP